MRLRRRRSPSSMASRARTAPTRTCSPTPRSRRCTSRCQTACTSTGPCGRLQAGKHVLCEKPMDRRPQRVAEAFDTAERAGLVLSEAFMWRHNPQTAGLLELLGDGAIGDVRLVRACFSFALAGDADVRLDPALDGGALMDVGCYCVSAARLIVRRRAGEGLGAERHGAGGRRPAHDRAAALRRRRAGDDRLRLRHPGARRARGRRRPTAGSCSTIRGIATGRGSCSSAGSSARSSSSSR